MWGHCSDEQQGITQRGAGEAVTFPVMVIAAPCQHHASTMHWVQGDGCKHRHLWGNAESTSRGRDQGHSIPTFCVLLGCCFVV